MEHRLILNTVKNNWTKEDRTMILGFMEYLFNELKISKPVFIVLDQQFEDDTVSIKVNLRLAYVTLEDRKIVIYCKDRGLLDILRSIAHELIHIKQLDEGRINMGEIPFYLKDGNVPGYDLEYEAYGLSGILVRNYRALLNEK